MQKAIIGKKVGMTQIFDENGKVIPVTVIEAGPCIVLQIKTEEKDGYSSVQLGFGNIKDHKLSKPELGHIKKAGVTGKRYLKEFRLQDLSNINVGDELKADIFSVGEKVDITGTSKGKGFAGPIKRHGVGRKRMSHGGGPVHRHLGSLGAGSWPSKIFKGRKMAGQMGAEQVTVQNLDIIKVDPELNMIAVKGAVPGPKKGIIYIKSTVKN